MATIAIGDIHGHRQALDDVLDQIRGEVGEGDTIVFLGDYIDRGPDSKGCIDAILQLQSETSAEVVCLLGNHEDWLLQTRRDFKQHLWLLGMEPFDTIRSYSVEAERILREALTSGGSDVFRGRREVPYGAFFDSVPQEHMQFFYSLRPSYQSADCVCTHGGLDTRVREFHEQPRQALIWGGGRFPYGYEGAEVVVYGHRNNAAVDADGWPHPLVVGLTIGVDTIAHGVLTAIRLPDRRVFQSARYESRESDAEQSDAEC